MGLILEGSARSMLVVVVVHYLVVIRSALQNCTCFDDVILSGFVKKNK